MATHSSIFSWKIPWTEEPGGLQSMGPQRVGHDWATFTVTFFPKRSHCENSESYHQIRATAPAVFHQEQSWPLGASGRVWTHLVVAVWGMEMGVVCLASSGERPGMLLTIPLHRGVLPILQCTGVLPILQCTGVPPTSFPVLWGRETLLCAACKCWKWLGCCHLPDPRFKFCSIKLMYHLMVDHSCWVIWPLVVIFCLFQTYYLIIKCLDFNR